MTQEATLGLDIGTTSVKAVVYAQDGRVVARASRRLTMYRPQPGWAEQDVVEIEQAVAAALCEAAKAARAGGWSVRRAGFSAAMHSLLAVAADGTPLTRALTWMDIRAAEDARRLRTNGGEALYRATGTPIHPMSPLVKLLWLRREQPYVWKRAARFVSIKEWIWHRWFGVWEVDEATASATGLYASHGGWHVPALDVAGLSADLLSRPVFVLHTRAGAGSEWLAAVGLDGANWTIGASDGVLANVGAGVWSSDSLVLTVGTSSAVRTTHEGPMLDQKTQVFSYILGRGLYVIGGPSNSGGGVLDWLAEKVLRSPDGAAGLPALLKEAGKVDANGIVMLPYAAGERAPLWDPGATAVVCGLRMEHTGAHVMRAAVEGILCNARWIAQPLIQSALPRRIWVSGPLFEQDWVRQMTADLFALPVARSGAADGSAAGAARVAEIAAGLRPWGCAPQAEMEQPAAGERWTHPRAEGVRTMAARFQAFAAVARRWFGA